MAGVKKTGSSSVELVSQSQLHPVADIGKSPNPDTTPKSSPEMNSGAGRHPLPGLSSGSLGSAVGPGPSCSGMRYPAI